MQHDCTQLTDSLRQPSSTSVSAERSESSRELQFNQASRTVKVSQIKDQDQAVKGSSLYKKKLHRERKRFENTPMKGNLQLLLSNTLQVRLFIALMSYFLQSIVFHHFMNFTSLLHQVELTIIRLHLWSYPKFVSWM